MHQNHPTEGNGFSAVRKEDLRRRGLGGGAKPREALLGEPAGLLWVFDGREGEESVGGTSSLHPRTFPPSGHKRIKLGESPVGR